MSERSFSIVKIESLIGKKVAIGHGRYLSKSPSGSAKKAFTQAAKIIEKCKKTKAKRQDENLRLNVTIVETTRNSIGKKYMYTVFRVPFQQLVLPSANRPAVIYKFEIKALSGLNRV